jgi:hypothetical protein
MNSSSSFLCALALFLPYSSTAHAGTNAVKEGECIVVDGPANLRQKPKGNVIMSIRPNSTVLVKKIEGDWVLVSGAPLSEASEGGDLRCYYSGTDGFGPNFRTGYLYRKNIKSLSWDEKLQLDPVGTLVSTSATSKFNSHFRATLKKDCRCAMFVSERHDASPHITRDRKSGELLGADCQTSELVIKCERFGGLEGGSIDYCPYSCVTVVNATPLLDKDRDRVFLERAKEEKSKLDKTLSPSFRAALDKRYPGWMPLLIRDPGHDTNYDFRLLMRSSAQSFDFEFQKIKKSRLVYLFFESLDRAKEAKATLGFESNSGFEFRRFPFDLKKDSGDLEGPSFYFSTRSEWTGVFACRSQDEILVPIGGFDIRGDASRTETAEEIAAKLSPGVSANSYDYAHCDRVGSDFTNR